VSGNVFKNYYSTHTTNKNETEKAVLYTCEFKIDAQLLSFYKGRSLGLALLLGDPHGIYKTPTQREISINTYKTPTQKDIGLNPATAIL
jgi:hypothetical protein